VADQTLTIAARRRLPAFRSQSVTPVTQAHAERALRAPRHAQVYVRTASPSEHIAPAPLKLQQTSRKPLHPAAMMAAVGMGKTCP
jgi:hypothetical protein